MNVIETLEKSTDELSHILREHISEMPVSIKNHVDAIQSILLDLLYDLK